MAHNLTHIYLRNVCVSVCPPPSKKVAKVEKNETLKVEKNGLKGLPQAQTYNSKPQKERVSVKKNVNESSNTKNY